MNGFNYVRCVVWCMEVYRFGRGEPEVSVVAGVHGDEPAGVRVVREFVEWIDSGRVRVERPVQFVIVNERAIEQGVRFVDVDMNRVFPGGESDKYEERVAADVVEVVRNTIVFDVHSTVSVDGVFGVVPSMYEVREYADLLSGLGVGEIAVLSEFDSTLSDVVGGIGVEVGPVGTDKAFEYALPVVWRFLVSCGVFDGVSARSNPRVIEAIDKVSGKGYEVCVDNFERVTAGEVFAHKNGNELVSDTDFYPVLMSTTGYEDAVGYKGVNRGRLNSVV